MTSPESANWLEAIEYVRGDDHDKRYVSIRDLEEGDSILHVELEAREYVGLYTKLNLQDLQDEAKGTIQLELPDRGRMELEGQAKKVGKNRYTLALGSEVTFFEIIGSQRQEIRKARRELGKRNLIEAYLKAEDG